MMHDTETLKQKVESLLQPFLAEAGLELIEINFRRYHEDIGIEVLADRPQGGITISECSWLNHKIIEALEQANILPDGYSLEVCSPGLDRPLKTIKDFSRLTGEEIHVFLSQPAAGKLEHEGILKDVQADAIVLATSKYGDVHIPIGSVVKGVRVI